MASGSLSVQPQSESTTGLMTAAVVVAPGRLELREVSIPTPGPNQILVRLEGCGVCASNLPPWEGKPWFTYPLEPGGLGHEGWGIIDAVGDAATGFEVGQRVAFLGQHSYAQYDTVTADAAVHLPPALEGQPFPAEPLGCAVNIFRRSGISAGQTVAIVGIGFLGALLTELASREGARVIAISRRQFALDAAARAGAAHTIAMDDHYRIIEAVRELTAGRFCDVVVEAVGKQWPLDLSAELTAERGRLVVAGYHQDGPRQVNMQLWNWRGIDVINAHERDPKVYLSGMSAAVELVRTGRMNPAPLYTHKFPLERLADAFDATRDRPEGFMKALVVMP
jgi:2-desacetyl-2-hydroxyethyl bacteriochlorophyllide A dehydrogenase